MLHQCLKGAVWDIGITEALKSELYKIHHCNNNQVSTANTGMYYIHSEYFYYYHSFCNRNKIFKKIDFINTQ